MLALRIDRSELEPLEHPRDLRTALPNETPPLPERLEREGERASIGTIGGSS